MLVDLVVTGAGVQMAVGDGEVAADVGADPVADVLLVHGVLVRLVLAGAGAVQVARLGVKLHTERKLRLLARFLIRLARIPEVKVSSNLVSLGPR